MRVFKPYLEFWISLNSKTCSLKSFPLICVKLLHVLRLVSACFRICSYYTQYREIGCAIPFPRKLQYIKLYCKTLILSIDMNHLSY